MKRVLVTGGPVHAHLDSVKIITNRFRGGLMSLLAEQLVGQGAEVTYLAPSLPGIRTPAAHERLTVLGHTGFEDYRRKVAELAPSMDGVVLGAAVANLVPAKPWTGKFPSHDYKPGDIVPIDFRVAERVIDEVKRVAPKTHLFGFKLLSGVSQKELIRAAYGIVLEAKATAVFANDTDNLQQKFAVTKERGVHPMSQDDLAQWIMELLADEYYSTETAQNFPYVVDTMIPKAQSIIKRYKNRFVEVEEGLVFGTVAVRTPTNSGFLTTARGKRELEKFAYVDSVDYENRKVYSAGGKASLNAPLLAKCFDNPAVDYIVHYHEQVEGLPTYPYAPPGTVRDSDRPNATSFNITEHGCVLLFDKEGRQL
jgi:phosphopantothenate-cysteine ligase